MQGKYIVATDSEPSTVLEGPYTTDEEDELWDVYRGQLQRAHRDPERDAMGLTTWDEWKKTEDYDGRVHWTNSFLKVTLFAENHDDGWNIGFYDRFTRGYVIDGSEKYDCSMAEAFMHFADLLNNPEKYLDVDLRTGGCYYIREDHNAHFDGPFETEEEAETRLEEIRENPDENRVRDYQDASEFTIHQHIVLPSEAEQ